jgi:hypothetical protein
MTTRAAIVGIGESKVGQVPDRSALQLQTDAAQAALAIASGQCSTVLCVAGQNLLSHGSRAKAVKSMAEGGSAHPQFEVPYGPIVPSLYALVARRHMHEYGTTPEQLAQVAVTIRRHASLNPNAHNQGDRRAGRPRVLQERRGRAFCRGRPHRPRRRHQHSLHFVAGRGLTFRFSIGVKLSLMAFEISSGSRDRVSR